MAFLGSINRECENRNRKNRRVQEYSGSLNLYDYWFHVSGNNFLITGGSESQRSQVLATAVCVNRRQFRGPIIVLNGSLDCEKKFIALASGNQLGRIIVSSPLYKNYDLFYDMPDTSIRTLFENAAQRRGVSDLSAFGDYTEAFLKVLKCKYTPCFHSMFAMARQSDQAIADFGSTYQVDNVYLNYIKNGVAGSSFRRILTDYGRAFLNIHGSKSTGYNISQIDNSDKIYIIWTSSESQELFNEVLAKELTYLRDTKGVEYLLIINDMNLVQNDPMRAVIDSGKKKSALGVCYADAMAFPGDESMQKIMVGNSPALLVLNSGVEDHEDQMNMLAKFGTYNHFEPMKGVDNPTGWFHLPGEGALHMGMMHFEKQRVTIDDMQGYAIAIRGDKGDTVSLYRRIGN